MLTKRDVIAIVERMPDASTLTEIFAELAVLHKIEQGRQISTQGGLSTTKPLNCV
jgi:hypothetical protein